MKKELLNLWKKNLWANKKYFLAVSACGMLLLSIIFFTMALGDCMSVVTTGKESDLLRGYATLSTFVSTYMLLYFLLIINILGYLKKRYYDYEMFTLLGIKTKHKYQFVAMEYGGIIILSVVGGILAGVIESEILCLILEKLFAGSVENVYYSLTPFVTTMVMGSIMFGLVFIALDLMIMWFGMAGVLGLGQKGGKPVRFRGKMAAVGVLVFVVAIVNLMTYLGKANRIVPIIMAVIAVYVLLKQSTAYMLVNLKRKNHDYYKKLLWLDSWYHQFQHHINMTYVVTAFVIIVLSYFMIGFMDNVKLTEEEHYPYDLVWLADQEDKEFISRLSEEYDAEINHYPCIRVTTPDEAENTGIPASVYEEMTGETLELTGEDIFIVYQRERSERDVQGIDYGSKNPRLYLGKAKAELWLANTKRASEEMSTTYKVTGTEDRILTGVFKDVKKENIIVFSDEFFAKIHPKIDSADMLVTANFSEERSGIIKEIREYAKKHSQTDFFALRDFDKKINFIYEKQEQILESKEEKLTLLTAICTNIVLLFICILFVFAEKMKNDEDEMTAKNQFCFLSGMTKKKRRQVMQREISFTSLLVLLWGIGVSTLLLVIQISLKHFADATWILWYAKGLVISAMVIIFIFVIVTLIEIKIIFSKAERSNENG